jgi:hypothetical protein
MSEPKMIPYQVLDLSMRRIANLFAYSEEFKSLVENIAPVGTVGYQVLIATINEVKSIANVALTDAYDAKKAEQK